MSYNYKILVDDVAEEDLSASKTHEKIADDIYHLIINETENGYPIGLEGDWGTGKSTVINLLRKKLLNEQQTFVFYIDTWEHEGDTLRKVFLESYIDQISNCLKQEDDRRKELDKIDKTISNKLITKEITHTQKPTLFGVVLGIAAFF